MVAMAELALDQVGNVGARPTRHAVTFAVSSDIRNPSRGDTENPATSATVMPRLRPVRMSP